MVGANATRKVQLFPACTICPEQLSFATGKPWGVPETTSSCCTWRSKSPLLVMWMVLELDEEPTFTAP